MSLTTKPGGSFRVTVKKSITRAAARKTLERLFMGDKVAAREVLNRTSRFIPKPKRRGGRIWTKYPNKLHLGLPTGTAATIKATPQHVRDLNSVAEFVEVTTA